MRDIVLELTRRYCEPHRRYHDLLHIAKMFSIAQYHGIELTVCQTWAIWFHDVVYIPGAKDNEEASCLVAREFLSDLDLTEEEVDIICEIIMATKDHFPTNEQSKIVIDLDLYGLGEEREYWRNSLLIRKEFATVPDNLFFDGRLKFLQSYRAREPLYVSEVFKGTELEINAKLNMLVEIEKLKSKIAWLNQKAQHHDNKTA